MVLNRRGNNNVDIISVRTTRFWNNLHQVRSLSKYWKAKYLFFQLKSLFEIFTFVSERNIKYRYLILASLILVACYGNSVSQII